MPSFPEEALILHEKLKAPAQLLEHHKAVHGAAVRIIAGISRIWSGLPIEEDLVCWGASVHDIGKVVHPEELFQAGNRHEEAGYWLLEDMGFSHERARFCRSHGDWLGPNITIEDLLVALADKAWRGERNQDLEDYVTDWLALRTNQAQWEVFGKLDRILRVFPICQKI